MCSDQSPWVVSDDLAYGFAAVSTGLSESDTCCSCYQLTFTSTSIAGKKMIVQATNTGGDVGEGQFDLAIPGGGVGLFNACSAQWGAPASGWGAQYGGLSSDTCSELPSALQPGCKFRFGDWFEGADKVSNPMRLHHRNSCANISVVCFTLRIRVWNTSSQRALNRYFLATRINEADHNIHSPEVDWEKVTCPKALTDITGCVRSGETPTSVKSRRPLQSLILTSLTFPPSDDAAPAAPAAEKSSSAASSSVQSSSSVVASSSSSVVASSSAASSVQASSTDAYVASSATGESALPTDQSPATSEPSNTPSSDDGDEEECEVQYVYEN
jgi:hypothetical protein